MPVARVLFAVLLFSTAAFAQQIDSRGPRSPQAGAERGGRRFQTPLPASPARLSAIHVNVGAWRGVGPVVKGLKLVETSPDGKSRETAIGPAGGEWKKPVELKADVELVGISGKSGSILDSLRFHFSDGSQSESFGGSGGDNEFRYLLKKKDGKFIGAVGGFHGRADDAAILAIGLSLATRDGIAPALDLPDQLTLTIRGDFDPKLTETVGKLAALYYECYPVLLAKFDDPARPASRHITLNFRRLGSGVPAFCTGSEITINSDYLKRRPDDLGMLTHELTHAVQQYPPNDAGWLTEGIADYSRHLYGPKVQPGWKLPERFGEKSNYKQGYGVTARFLVWLEAKHPGSVDKLHRRMQARKYEPLYLKELTGKTLDELWAACVAELSAKPN
ncbi:MAG TPA: basic secretory protein-like protein [Planctomycetia bacterium]|nr:basic secretory protein-like protein [Planctomycetia bacterium]